MKRNAFMQWGLMLVLLLEGCVYQAPRALAMRDEVHVPPWPALMWEGSTDQLYQVERATFADPNGYAPASSWLTVPVSSSAVVWRSVGPGLYRVRTRRAE